MSPSVNAVYRSLFTNKPKDITHKKKYTETLEIAFWHNTGLCAILH